MECKFHKFLYIWFLELVLYLTDLHLIPRLCNYSPHFYMGALFDLYQNTLLLRAHVGAPLQLKKYGVNYGVNYFLQFPKLAKIFSEYFLLLNTQ